MQIESRSLASLRTTPFATLKMNYIYVAIGSAVGGVMRMVIGTWFQLRLGGGARPFPIGTLLVNASGSFLIGILIVAMARKTDHATLIQYLLVVGFCGGYTTFSTFSADTVALVESGSPGLAALNVTASLALALGATMAGFVIARAVLGRA